MKNKKILSSILVLAIMFMVGSFVYAIPTSTSTYYTGLSVFEDMEPSLVHNEPYVDTVISCNMVLKPKTQINLSRLCGSAVTNLNYYFNGSGNVQKGQDYNNTVKEETFYPTSGRISESYLGGTIDYKVLGEFQTLKSTGDKINLETPAEFKTAVIISSITKEVDLGVATTITVPTGDQSQPDWVGISEAIPGCEGFMVPWTFKFGSAPNRNSFANAIFKVKTKKVLVLSGVNGAVFTERVNNGHIYYGVQVQLTSLNDELMEICKQAKKLIMQYNENPASCDEFGRVVIEDGWQDIDAQYASVLKVTDDNRLAYPQFINAYGRIIAVLEVEEPSTDYRPAKRTRIKSRIADYGGFKFNNLVDGDVVKIYNVNGQKVAELTAGETSEGFEWKGRKGTNNSGDWAKSGIYIYQIKLKEQGKIISGTIVFAY